MEARLSVVAPKDTASEAGPACGLPSAKCCCAIAAPTAAAGLSEGCLASLPTTPLHPLQELCPCEGGEAPESFAAADCGSDFAIAGWATADSALTSARAAAAAKTTATPDSVCPIPTNSGGAVQDAADALWAVNVDDLDSMWVTPCRRSTLVSIDLPLSPEGFLGLHLRRARYWRRQYRRDRHRDLEADAPAQHVRQGSVDMDKDDSEGRHHRRGNDDPDHDHSRSRSRSRSRRRHRGHKHQRGRHAEAAPWEITLHGFNPDRNPYLNQALARASADPANHSSTTASTPATPAAAAAPPTATADAWLPMGAVLRLVDGCEVLHPEQFDQRVEKARERHLARVAKLEALSPGSGARVRTVLRIGFDVSNVTAVRRATAGDGDSDDDEGDDATSSPRLKLHTTSSKSLLSRAGPIAASQMPAQAAAVGATADAATRRRHRPVSRADL